MVKILCRNVAGYGEAAVRCCVKIRKKGSEGKKEGRAGRERKWVYKYQKRIMVVVTVRFNGVWKGYSEKGGVRERGEGKDSGGKRTKMVLDNIKKRVGVDRAR